MGLALHVCSIIPNMVIKCRIYSLYGIIDYMELCHKQRVPNLNTFGDWLATNCLKYIMMDQLLYCWTIKGEIAQLKHLNSLIS